MTLPRLARGAGPSALLALALAAACTAGPAAVTPDEEMAWPTENPRVRLDRVLSLRELPRGTAGRMLGWLTGERRASGLGRPHGVAWAGDDLVITDPPTGTVLLLGAGGRPLAVNRGAFTSPIGVAVCPAGVVVTDSREGRVGLLDDELRLVGWLAEELDRPTGVACSGAAVYVAETGRHRIVILEPDGSRRTFGGRGSEPGQLNFPTVVALADGSLWVGDTLNFRIQELDAEDGAVRGVFGRLGDAPGDLPRIKGIALDARGRLWVSDAHLDRVALFEPDGTFLMDLGARGDRPGELSFPAGIAARPDGRVAVVDALNRRLQIFELLPGNRPGS
ncbi:MAG: hypothetical protein PVG07_15080 [Acidobacteriota bacterium]|jgi:hypothetical protein